MSKAAIFLRNPRHYLYGSVPAHVSWLCLLIHSPFRFPLWNATCHHGVLHAFDLHLYIRPGWQITSLSILMPDSSISIAAPLSPPRRLLDGALPYSDLCADPQAAFFSVLADRIW